MKTYAVYLKPKGSYPGTISSDTLFGAFCWATYVLYGEDKLKEVLSNFDTAPKFLLSSPFPYIENSATKVRFFPKPKFPAPSNQMLKELTKRKTKTDDVKSLKFKRGYLTVIETFDEIKDTLFLSEQIFKEIVEGNLGLVGISQHLKTVGFMDKDIENIGNTFITYQERKEIDPDGELLIHLFMKEADIQRNQIDRVTGTTAEGLLFFSTQTFLLKREEGAKSGLWFLLKTDDFEFLEPLLRYIADTGIGGDRSVGKGHFDISWDEGEELPESKKPNCFVNLSRYLPDSDEIDITKTPLSYTLRNIRGKHESKFLSRPRQPHFKEMVRVFEESSIFPLIVKKPFYGRLEKVGEKSEVGRDVYQNGITISIFAKIEVQNEVQ